MIRKGSLATRARPAVTLVSATPCNRTPLLELEVREEVILRTSFSDLFHRRSIPILLRMFSKIARTLQLVSQQGPMRQSLLYLHVDASSVEKLVILLTTAPREMRKLVSKAKTATLRGRIRSRS